MADVEAEQHESDRAGGPTGLVEREQDADESGGEQGEPAHVGGRRSAGGFRVRDQGERGREHQDAERDVDHERCRPGQGGQGRAGDEEGEADCRPPKRAVAQPSRGSIEPAASVSAE
ncbi:MAG TPA: hypothetical protein VFX16_08110 [Pseudonocardiaceae bacterium]|nr:hypothetical protein [Pseudonocardiaceae bacterium]